ncbi:MAG: HPr family phosphocarrier protein [Agathobacter sp.]|nr:HPr family phosphocarrier protein [Agathobacter sp.]
MYILLDSIDKVMTFVNAIMKQDAELDLISGHRQVDGKSLLGIFSLDLTKPIEVRVLTNKDSKQLTSLLNKYEAVKSL